MKHKKKSAIKGGVKNWVIFAVCILAVLAVLFIWQRQKEKAFSGKTGGITVSEERGKSFTQKTLTEKQKKEQDQRAMTTAMVQGDKKACDAILDETKKQACLDQIASSLAIKNNDETQCGLIHDAKAQTDCMDQIYFNLASSELDLEFCEKIQSEKLKQLCKDRLGLLLAGSGEKIQACEAISSPTLKTQCMDQAHYTTGLKHSDGEECGQIESSELSSRCLAAVEQNQKVIMLSQQMQTAALRRSAAEALLADCDKLGQEAGACKDEANIDLALEKQDISFCSRIGDAARRDECVTLVTSHLNRFYLKQAIVQHEPGLCQKITNAGLKTECISYLSK